MLSMILAVLCSAMISIIMRFSRGRVKHDIGMLTMNYIVCVLLAGLYSGSILEPGDSRTPLILGMGCVNGLLYLAGFILIQFNTNRNGVVLSSIFQKLGLLVSMVVSICFYHEIPTLVQTTGFVLAIAAIVLMNYQKGEQTSGSRVGLIGMLLACGLGEAMSKVFKESPAAPLEGQFLFITFFVALLLCALLMHRKEQRIGISEALYGTLIAIPNFFSAKFLLGALETLPAVIVYPVYSVGCILTVTVAGVFAFRERLSKNQWIGIGVILVALVLLNV
ncbi:MAG: EamA family transporter [Faecousia sp.]